MALGDEIVPKLTQSLIDESKTIKEIVSILEEEHFGPAKYVPSEMTLIDS